MTFMWGGVIGLVIAIVVLTVWDNVTVIKRELWRFIHHGL